MKVKPHFYSALTLTMLAFGLTACDKPGPAETAGKKIDHAVESASDATAKQGQIVSQTIDDAQITGKVKSALLVEPSLHSAKISVSTTQGVVTLSGSTDSQLNIDKAIELAKSIEGVQLVKSKLIVSK